jgi:hypothetical protein
MRRSHHFVATCFAIIAVGTSAVASAEVRTSAGNGDVVESTNLHPFTHVAAIPMGPSLSSVRIESIKLVKVATKRRTVTNDRYCNLPWMEPGGSMACQRTADEAPMPAYRVTYSYRGQPLASDEYANTYFTFSVYFRPDEIGPRLREMVAFGKVKRADLEEFFQLGTSRESVQQTVIDPANSAFCDGNYVDGNWIRTNPKCGDRVVYHTVAAASPYISVRVDPTYSRIETAAAAREPWRQ